jgi:hypothetical protein
MARFIGPDGIFYPDEHAVHPRIHEYDKKDGDSDSGNAQDGAAAVSADIPPGDNRKHSKSAAC